MKNSLNLVLSLTLLFVSCKSDKKSNEVIVEEAVSVIDENSIAIEEDSITVEFEEPIVKAKAIYEYTEDGIDITAISHATMVLEYNGVVIYIDPVGGKAAFKGHKAPTFILITDIHGDHLNVETIQEISNPTTVIIGPKAVKEKIPEVLHANYSSLFNGLGRSFQTSKINLEVEAIAMYNLPEDETSRHPKGRGNGYVLTINEKRIYISGDTEDIFEMRHLKNIDMAFVCMNLPYTMTVDSAASAVLQFKPKEVFPYHYRGKDGFSDVEKFKSIVNEVNSDIKVIQLDWYHE
jgi:L-ascorbate metabolism protein UlaG (beta-lactamase superfamily)